MSQLFGLLYKARNFFLFLFLEIISLILVRKNNVHWDVSFFNTTNSFAAKTLEVTHNTKEYLYLKKVNETLSEENTELRKKLTFLQQLQGRPDSFYTTDSIYSGRFNFWAAKVINSTTGLTDNYLTLNKGKLDGILPGMGVISSKGVIGQVMSCSDHYSRVYSILHSDFTVSSEVLNKDLTKLEQTALGLCNWSGSSHRVIQMNTVDKFKPVHVGDSVVTSEQNLIFPSKIMVGKVKKVVDDNKEAFHKIDVELSTDFTGLTYVYVVENKLITEEENIQIVSEK